jgi:hypothetical protein
MQRALEVTSVVQAAEGTPARLFELVSTNKFPSGVILNTYEATGPLKAG